MFLNCGVGEDSWKCPCTSRRSNQSILKEINPEYSLEGLMLKLKLQYFGHQMWWIKLIEKDPDAGKDWRQEEKGITEDEMVGWHHWLDGHKFEQGSRVGDGEGSLACCSPWGCRELNVTEWLNKKFWFLKFVRVNFFLIEDYIPDIFYVVFVLEFVAQKAKINIKLYGLFLLLK